MVIGHSTTWSLLRATYVFSARAGSTVQNATQKLDLGSSSTSWYETPSSKGIGSKFKMVVAFTFQGDLNAIGSVSVTLSNQIGSSNSKSANF